jgi:alkylhydroperoxidase family enzyme
MATKLDALPDAWVDLPSETEVRTLMPPGHPYDFGFLPAMVRLVSAHDAIAPHFGALFTQIMFAPGALDRREREMVAAVAAAAQDCHY